jgi:hypothetical protein
MKNIGIHISGRSSMEALIAVRDAGELPVNILVTPALDHGPIVIQAAVPVHARQGGQHATHPPHAFRSPSA